MKIDNIQSTNFQSRNPFSQKRRFMTLTMQSRTNSLLQKMNNGTQYKQDETGTSFISNVLASINIIGKDVKFTDERYLLGPVQKPENYPSKCSLEMGKTYLCMNAITGEILAHKKSFFRSWKSVLSQAESCLQIFTENFNNSEVVKQSFLIIPGYTKKGAEILKKIKQKIGYYR